MYDKYFEDILRFSRNDISFMYKTQRIVSCIMNINIK